MPVVLPYVPERITVHLGSPDSNAANVTVPFVDYVKNVASSEIYPTWDESALRANILAIISFALNRIYTEFYPSRGYDFNITSSTAIDQAFVNGRSTFATTDRIVDEIFNDYIRRQGFVEPLAAKFCNGTTVTCAGLSQWGSQALAEEGLSSLEILRNYYGNNIELVTDAPITGLIRSYPGAPLQEGSRGPAVVVIQTALNRISQNYPAIPKISPVDGIFGPQTQAAVRRFQQIFNLTPDGIVGKATWYALVRIYVGVTRLSELRSEGQRYYNISWNYGGVLQPGSAGTYVRQLQYMLQVLASFIPAIPAVETDGLYGPATANAVRAAQRYFGLPQTGTVDEGTWLRIHSEFSGARDQVFRDGQRFPEATDQATQTAGGNGVSYEKTTTLRQHPGRALQQGDRDEGRQEGAV